MIGILRSLAGLLWCGVVFAWLLQVGEWWGIVGFIMALPFAAILLAVGIALVPDGESDIAGGELDR